MKEKTIMKVAIVAVVIGLIFLLVYSEEVEIEQVERIDSAVPEEIVELHGKVTRVSQYEKVVFVTVEGYVKQTTEVILFSDHEVYLKEGDSVEIQGTVEEYEGKKEVIANSITIR